jgi:hypothetical protein
MDEVYKRGLTVIDVGVNTGGIETEEVGATEVVDRGDEVEAEEEEEEADDDDGEDEEAEEVADGAAL